MVDEATRLWHIYNVLTGNKTDSGKATAAWRKHLSTLPGFELALQGAVQAGKQAWKGLQLEDGAAEAWFCARLDRGEDPLAALDNLRTKELTITCMCSQGSSSAIAALEHTYFRGVTHSLRRMNTNIDVVDETTQLLRYRLFVAEPGREPKISTYSGRGDLGRWLCMVAFREALQLIKKSKREASVHEGLLAALPNAAQDLEIDYLKRHYHAHLKTAIQEAAGLLNETERYLLQLHYSERLGIDGIAKILRVHRSTAARRVSAARHSLLVQLKRTLLHNLQVRSSEVMSIMHLLSSRLDVSLGGVFGHEDAHGE